MVSVGAIREATLQVLLEVGKDKLTTTRVANRAGVSVGTLYQYFPNKSALLQAVLRGHLESVAEMLEAVCRESRGAPLAEMPTRVVHAFLEAKLKDMKTSMALYAVSSDVEGWRIVQETSKRINGAIVAMLESAREPLQKDARLTAAMIQGAMAGVSRRLLESAAPEKDYEAFKRELGAMVAAYVNDGLG